MKATIQGIITAASCLLLTSPTHVFAIEGLQLSVQCSNVVLRWPSVEPETYFVQYRPTLDPGTPWQTLTSSLPADVGTNMTYFVHSNVVQHPNCGGGGWFGSSAFSSGGGNTFDPLANFIALGVPLAMPVSSSGDTVPVFLYPPGFEFSGFLIFDPANEDWFDGSGYVATQTPLNNEWPGPGPENDEGGGGGTNSPTEAAFYRVVRSGVHIFGLTNDTVLSGIIEIPVEAAYDRGFLSSVILNANGKPIPGTPVLSQRSGSVPGVPVLLPPPLQSLSFSVDTRRLDNGDYYLQARGQWSWSSTNRFEVRDAQLNSPYVLVHVTNDICFPNWIQEFRDDLMLVKVTSAKTNCDWQIDIYGQSGDFVRSFTNHSVDGLIDVSWDLRDTNGNPRTDSTFTTVTKILDPAIATNPPLIHVVDNYPDQGKWIIARADYIPHNAQNYNLYVSVENAFAQIAETAGGVLPGPPFRNPGEAFVLTDITNASAFASAFTNRAVRNFYWDGHGGPDGIGDFPAPDGEMSGFPSATIAFLIGNTTPSTNSTRYRWVWIDSCESALGNWPETFGMGNRENVPLANYVSRPATFCGFTHKVYGYTAFQGGTSSIDIDSINYRSYFQLFWEILGEPVIDSFDDAEFYSGDYYTAQFLKVYGYWGLHLNEYNTKPEWP